MNWSIFVLGILLSGHIEALQPVHLAIVVCGDRLPEALNALKSSLIFTPPPMIFHVFTEDHLRQEFRERIDAQWPLDYQSKFTMEFHPIEYPRGNDERWRTLFKPCCTQRLFLPEILKEIDSVLYVDTDVLFLSNVRHLWRLFRKFNSTQLAALSPEHEEPSMGWYNRFARHPYYGSLGLNSGVMLMNLTRMRQVKMISEVMQIFDEFHLNITWGDQCLLNIYFNYHPDRMYEFSCDWNYRPDHCIYENNCHQAAKDGIKILHGCRSAFHNEKYLEFRSIYQVIAQWNFDRDVKPSLLTPIQANLELFGSTNCGKSSSLFTKHLSKEISSLAHSLKHHYHLALLINDNWNLIDQSHILLKSLLLFSPNKSTPHFHLHVILTDPQARTYFSQRMESLVHSIDYYNTSIQHPLELPSILNVDRVIYLNPNVIFINSIDQLWSSFEQFDTRQTIGLFAQCHRSGFSNLLLLHLSRMKSLQMNFQGINQLSTENVYFLPCKYILEPDRCQSIEEILFLPEIVDPSLFDILHRTISQMNVTNINPTLNSMLEDELSRVENVQCRDQLIDLIKTHRNK